MPETCSLQETPEILGVATIPAASPAMALTARDDHQLPLIQSAAGDGGSTLNSQPDSIVAAKPMSPPGQPRKIRRNGRVACLPRVYRDMVNRMLWNAVPYKNIVAALDDEGYTLTERNISNWATGGYLEWRLEQEAVLQNRLDQDHLVSFLKREDAGELPEVGLQAAATRLSQVLLQKLAHADDPEAHLDSFSRMIDLLCRLNREIAATQTARDNSRRSLGPTYDPVLVQETDKINALETERHYSDPPAASKLSKPAEPAFVPPEPTDHRLELEARAKKAAEEADRVKQNLKLLESILGRSRGPSSPATPESPSGNSLVAVR